jgi:endonuclease/exonuclease/phosphatase family metal-dependent hydrolase
MRRTPSFLRSLGMGLALILPIASCSAPEAPDDVTLTVLSYNIHHGEGTDGVFDLERIAQVILDSEADLVALQEVDVNTGRSSGVDQASELARLTGMTAYFGEAIPYDGGSYGDAVLSRLPVSSHQNWMLPAEPNHEKRVAVSVVAELPNGQNVRFIGTHLDHTSNPSDRVAQAKKLLELAFPEGKDSPGTLLLGDMNAQPGSEPMRLLMESFDSAAPDGTPSFPSDEPVRAIDWVLYAPRDLWKVELVEVLHAPIASDHAPLRAILSHKLHR